MKKIIIAVVGSILLVGTIVTGLYAGSAASGLTYTPVLANTQVQNQAATVEQPKAVLLSAAVQNNASSDVQEITANAEPFGYPEIMVEAGRPVCINFKVTEANLNACNNEIIIPSQGISKKLNVGDNFVEFIPDKGGTIPYSCWMDMIRSNIIVTTAAQTATETVQLTARTTAEPTPTPDTATVSVTVNVDSDVQEIEAKVAPGGYPQIVVEKDMPVRINFKVAAADLNSCNNELYIPEWNITKKLSVGDNLVEFTPTKTGTFNYSCWMGMINSSITVIEQGTDDVGVLPMDASANQPKGCGMMSGNNSSNSWFGGMMDGSGSSGGSCCGRR